MKSVNINDIAAEIGLSRNTVSKVLSNKGGVGKKTKKKIIQAAYRMGYQKLSSELLSEINHEPSHVCGNKNRGNVVVIANKSSMSGFWGIVMTGVCSSLANNLYSPVYCLVEDDESSSGAILQIPSLHSPAGIIVANIYNKAVIATVANLGLPTVYYDCPVGSDAGELRGDVILVEGVLSVKTITLDLIKKGCTDAVFIGDTTYSRTLCDRFTGFSAAFEEMSLTSNKQNCLTSDSENFYTKESIDGAMKQLRTKGMPSAIVSGNDWIARMVIIWLVEHGYNVPKQVRVSGYDDSPECEIMQPTITSVKHHTQGLGNRLAKQLMERIKNEEDMYETIIISAKVKFRKSTS